MKFDKPAIIINGLMLLIFGIWGMLTGGSAGLGLAGLLIALLNIPLALFFFIRKNKAAANTCLLCIGIFLLAGFSICSQSSFNMH